VQYNVIGVSKVSEFHESTIDIIRKERVAHEVVNPDYYAALMLRVGITIVTIRESPANIPSRYEFTTFIEACQNSALH
jgi:hypothetical protein